MKQFSDLTKIIHKEGYIFIFLFLIAALILYSVSAVWGMIGGIATCWCIYFFRNPTRYTPIIPNAIISSADGIVQSIKEAPPPTELNLGDEPMLRISVFLNIFNVHVNRIPIDGKIVGLHYNPGKFLNASLDKASIHNERQSIVIETHNKTKIICVQIAGLIARRIVCDLENDEEVLAGKVFGIIRFGSRVDIYLPKKTIPLVSVGQTCIAGETILANLEQSNKVSAPKFEIR